MLGCVLACLLLFWLVINLIPPRKNVAENPFLVPAGGLPMIAALLARVPEEYRAAL